MPVSAAEASPNSHEFGYAQFPDAQAELARNLSQGPMVAYAGEANRQHYEVPTEFFCRVLGKHLKYSSGYWPTPQTTLDEAEAAMLELTVERAGLHDGQQILELGCGWGSLTLWMADQFPQSQITAVSNSRTQREFIESEAARRGHRHVHVVTANIADFEPPSRYDRVVSVEMFEHIRNHQLLLHRIRQWLQPGGKLFVHIFCHRDLTYLFESEGEESWMGRHFFSGGMMPAADWLPRFSQDLQVQQQWSVNGKHYARSCEAWLQRLDQQREEIERLFRRDLDAATARRQIQRWRMFFIACAELFAFRKGQEWFVSHYLFGSQ